MGSERTIRDFVDLWPGTRKSLAAAMGKGRHPNTLALVERCRFARPPLVLLTELQAALADVGLIDGSPAPTISELVVTWQRDKRRRESGQTSVDAGTAAQ